MEKKGPQTERNLPGQKCYRVIYQEQEETHQLVEEPLSIYGYSFAYYLQWKLKERLELIRGRIFKLSAPNTKHQRVAVKLTVELYNHLETKKCQIFAAPFDVRLPRNKNDPDEKIRTVVQPDICVVCDESKIDEKGCCGAPDLVVEILSPSNSSHDVRTKFNLYQEAGVPEYWLINPEEENLVIFTLDKTGKYCLVKMVAAGDIIASQALRGFELEVSRIFDFPAIRRKSPEPDDREEVV